MSGNRLIPLFLTSATYSSSRPLAGDEAVDFTCLTFAPRAA